MVKFDPQEYRLVRGSDLDRDGTYLELMRVAVPDAPLDEYFYSDTDHTLTLTLYVEALPQAVLAWFRRRATQLLLPS